MNNNKKLSLVLNLKHKDIVESLLEILKYCVPALIVFATVYFMMKKHYTQQYHLQALKFKQKKADTTLPLKLQAYERLTLFLERISPENLMMRLSSSNMQTQDLKNAMMLAIQQEFEHNLTQQIYVSDSLWKIIKLAKDQMINIVVKSGDQLRNGAHPSELVDEIRNTLRSMDTQPLPTAKAAIKKEIEILL